MPPKTRADRAEELRRSIRSDFMRACANLYMIEPREGASLQYFSLWPEQVRQTQVMLEAEKAGKPVRILKLKCRQAGDSTLAQAWLFHKVMWTTRQRALVVAHDDETTNRLFDMSKLFYNELPPELQVPIEKLNRREIQFQPPHGSLLSAQTAGWQGLGHGRTFQHMQLSEVDRWVDPVTTLDGLLPTVPRAAGTSVIMESVAEFPDGFLKGFWDATKRGDTEYVPLFTPWFDVPDYRHAVPAEFAPLSEEEQSWVAKYGVTLEQIAWYRLTLAEFLAKEPWGGERKMRRLYPCTDDEAFQAAGLCIFPDRVLNRLKTTLARPALTFRLVATGDGRIVDVPTPLPEDADLWVWEAPKEGVLYSIGVDVSDGVGATESVVQVCRYPDYAQAAEWASNRTSPEQTAWVVRWLAEKYGGGNTLVIPEINKSGVLVLHILQSMPGTFSLFRWRYLNRPGQAETNNPSLGWETNARTKAILAQVANMVFLRDNSEAPSGVIHSHVLHDQMKRCVDVVPGRRWAVTKGDSDRILAWLIAMTGAYLDFEGGDIGGMASDGKERPVEPEKARPEPNAVDGDWDRILGDAEERSGVLTAWDTLT